MRTQSYTLRKEIYLRCNLRQLFYWPFKISQCLGTFPFFVNSENEYEFHWTGFYYLFTLLYFVVSLTFSIGCFIYKQEILSETMGGLSNTENYASTFGSGFVLVLDKFLIIYVVFARKAIIKFQNQFNKVMEYVVNEAYHFPNLFYSNSLSCTPWEYIEQKTRSCKKFGVFLVIMGFMYEISVVLFHVARLIQPGSNTWKNYGFIIACTVGQCSMTVPRLCFIYFVSLKVCVVKSTFKLLRQVSKMIVRKKVLNEEEKDLVRTETEIGILLEMYNELEKLVIKFNNSFGIQLLGSIVMSLVVVTGVTFMICVNLGVNFGWVLMIGAPQTAFHWASLVFLCHNSSRMTVTVSALFGFIFFTNL